MIDPTLLEWAALLAIAFVLYALGYIRGRIVEARKGL
jgi:hypothetical protein